MTTLATQGLLGAGSTLADPDTPPIELTQQVNCVDRAPLVYMSLAIKVADAGSASQRRCSEMLQWDEYKSARNINDGAPRLMEYFASPSASQTPPMPFSEGANRVLYASLAIDPCLSGSSEQLFCSEMLHWDDMSESKSSVSSPQIANSPKPVLMRDLFKPIRSVQKWFFQGSELYCEVSVSRTSASGAPVCSEMLHWTDLQATPTPKQGSM